MNEAVAAAADDLAININERPATFFLSAFPFRLGRHLPDDAPDVRPAAAGGVRVRRGFAASPEAARSARTSERTGRGISGSSCRSAIPTSGTRFTTSWWSCSAFLTGDRFAFDFVYRERKPPKRPGLGHRPWRRGRSGRAALRRARLADRSDRRPDRLDRQGPAGDATARPPRRGASRSSSRDACARCSRSGSPGSRQGPPDRHQGPRDHPALAILPLRRARLCGRLARRRLARQLLRERHRQREPPDQPAGRRHDGDAHHPSAVPAQAR